MTFVRDEVQRELYFNMVRTVHQMGSFAKELVLAFDADKDGHISENEFADIIDCLNLHEPEST